MAWRWQRAPQRVCVSILLLEAKLMTNQFSHLVSQFIRINVQRKKDICNNNVLYVHARMHFLPIFCNLFMLSPTFDYPWKLLVCYNMAFGYVSTLEQACGNDMDVDFLFWEVIIICKVILLQQQLLLCVSLHFISEFWGGGGGRFFLFLLRFIRYRGNVFFFSFQHGHCIYYHILFVWRFPLRTTTTFSCNACMPECTNIRHKTGKTKWV